jgi:hypothetical protein
MREDAGIVGAYHSGVQAGLTELVGGGPTVGARARPTGLTPIPTSTVTLATTVTGVRLVP